jgi:ribosomal protein S18 acetylase RimI-like enzyme
MANDEIVIRRAARGDLPSLGELGAALVRAHMAFDHRRFLHAGEGLADGYAGFLRSQLTSRDATVIVAEHRGRIVGYVYVGIEPMSWQELRDEAGFIHDLVVDEGSRGLGIGSQLVDAAISWLRQRGMPRVLLHTAVANHAAQRLFAKHGFRSTMIEMTREID